MPSFFHTLRAEIRAACGQARSLRGWGICPRLSEVSADSWLVAAQVSLPTASPGVSSVSRLPFYKDASQSVKASCQR